VEIADHAGDSSMDAIAILAAAPPRFALAGRRWAAISRSDGLPLSEEERSSANITAMTDLDPSETWAA